VGCLASRPDVLNKKEERQEGHGQENYHVFHAGGIFFYHLEAVTSHTSYHGRGCDGHRQIISFSHDEHRYFGVFMQHAIGHASEYCCPHGPPSAGTKDNEVGL
jgi:hypothetical protein